MDQQLITTIQTNEQNLSPKPKSKGGRPVGSSNLHSKHPSGIAIRLKTAGVDWIESFGFAIKKNDKALLNIWLRLLPYLIITPGHRRVKKFKGHASKAAIRALEELEGVSHETNSSSIL